MPGQPVLMRRGYLEGSRKTNGVHIRAYGEKSFHNGAAQIPAELSMCKRIVTVLNTEYPGHAWGVEVMMDQGVAKVTIPALLGFNWGYILHLDTIDKGAIVKAGGEILERFRIPRSSIDLAFYADAKSRIPQLGNFRAGSRSLIPA